MKTLKLSIRGRVQGVFFRRFIVDNAITLGIRGYVMNLRDGSVEAVIQGIEDSLKEIVDLCKRGPVSAKVTKILIEEIGSPENFQSFEIRF